MNIQSGDFYCTAISGNIGRLISLGEFLDGSGFSHYEHTGIYIGNDQTIAAYPGGAAIGSMPNLGETIWSSNVIALNDITRTIIVSTAHSMIGTPYSAADYFALVAHRLHIPVPGLRDYISTSKHMICSQLVDYIYLLANIHLFTDNRWPGYVTPADLANLIK